MDPGLEPLKMSDTICAKDVLESWNDVKDSVKMSYPCQFEYLNRELIKLIRDPSAVMTKEKAKNFGEYFALLSHEDRIDVWSAIADGVKNIADIAMLWKNSGMSALICEVFQVVPGARGQKAVTPDFMRERDSKNWKNKYA